MKKSVLKQSIIALMVGSAVSGASMAADADSLTNAANVLKDAIKSEVQAQTNATKAEQDTKINDIKSKLNDLASFVLSEGSEDAPTLAYQLKQLSDELDNKVDVSTVNKIVDELNQISALTDEHGDKFDELKGILSKLDEADVQLAGRVNTLTTEVEGLVSSNDEHSQDITTLKNIVLGEDGTGDTDGLVKNVEDNTNAIAELKNTQTFQDLEYVKNSIKDVRTKTKDAIEGMAKHLDEAVLPAIEANRTDIDANKADVDTLKNKVAGAAAAVDLLTQNIALNKTNIESKADQDYVEGLERDVKANTSDIKDLSVGIRDHVLPAIEANRSDIDKNASHITDIRNKQALQNARLDNHGERIEANKAAIGDLARATNEAVTNLGNAVSGLDEDLAGTQDAVAENRKDIDKNASRITDTRNKQVLQNARLDNHSSRIDANKAALETKADKTALEGKADKADVDANKTEIAKKANASDVYTKAESNSKLDAKANASEVYTKTESDSKLDAKANASEVYTKTESDSKLNAKANASEVYSKTETDNKFALKADNSVVSAHTKRLDHLDNRVNKLDKDLKRGLAAQAALTGLFQPYTVGKANFTAAVGGYKSQTAVAIGTGYRYTQNIATKAGVAFTQGGGVTYNAGVNFEW